MARKSESVAETPAVEAPLTQRAYTLRLRGVNTQDDSWRDALWATHEAVNKGARVFGDWLLTLRGGLSHELVDQKVFEGKGANKKERGPTDNERRDRRILLALSWLSVESAPRDDDDPRKPFLTGCGNGPAGREQALREALRAVLQQRGVPAADIGDPNVEPEHQPDTWLGQCGSSLAARIRDDAVWVNRNAMFDAATSGWNMHDARKDAHTLLSFILSANKDDFLTLPTPKKPKNATEETDEGDEQEERQKAVKASSRGAGQRTRHPFSHLLGEGKPFGNPKRKLILRDQWHGHIKPRLEAIGIPVLDARTSNKGKRKDAAPAHTELQREMFSKAASRIAQIVTKQRQQEADRLARKDADAELRKMEADPSYGDALAGLRTYCDEYRVSSGATGEFMIRPRQITGWDRVVKRWAAIEEADPDAAREARIDAVKETQEADEEKKFGDPNLFFRLADDRYTSVWRMNGKADPTILERFVMGMKARSDSERLKVAAFRHPDPYFNPIFCQFGVSRPAIHFRRLKAFSDSPAGDDPRAVGMLLWHPAVQSAKLTLMYGVSQRMDREIGSACDQVHQDAATLQSVSRRGRLGMAAAGLPSADSPARVAGVFDLKKIRSRSTDDDEEDSSDEGNGNGKLKEPRWNGTLSTNRRDLAVIGKLVAGGDVQKVQRRREQLRWTLTVSMEMEGRGPWFRYVATAQDQTPFVRTARKDKPNDKNDLTKGLAEQKGDRRIEAEGWPWQEFNKPLKDNRDGTALVEDAKATRGDKACLILSRLPGLRVLSVDLGHRFAASCAVWEAISTEDMAKACREHGHRKPEESDLFIHLTRTVKKERTEGRDKGKTVDVVETTIYRRIGSDQLPDGSEHPGSWARLDRQFFIKLQGEERPVRMASEAEHEYVKQLEDGLRYARGERTPLPWQVDQLMAEAVRTVRLALRRHGDAARLAFGLASDYKPMPGDKKFWFTRPQDDDPEPQKDAEKKAADRAVKHTGYLQDLLCLWHDLAVSARWRDDDALNRWNTHVLPLIQRAEFTEPPPLQGQDANDSKRIERRKKQVERWKAVWEFLRVPLQRRSEEQEEGAERSERKADREAVRGLLAPMAEALRNDPQKRSELATQWKVRWNEDDACWPGRLKRVRCWLLPRGLRARRGETQEQTKVRKARRGAAMNVGGLSLTRLATLTEFRRQVQVGYFTRLKPDGTKAEIKEEFGQRILDAVDGMREQRVKQIASRIVEAALGVGIERDRVWDDEKKKWRYPKRPRSLLYHEDGEGNTHGDPRFKTCHAVVIENLRNYRPDELQTRRENRALMNWSAGKVRKYLEEACQLHGLHLREVMPNYTSRQCSRTGLPGWRCEDIPVVKFVKPHWCVKKAVKNLAKNVNHDATWEVRLEAAVEAAKAKRKDRNAPGEQEDCCIVELFKRWESNSRTWTDSDGVKWKLIDDDEKTRWEVIKGQTLRADKKYFAPAAVRVLNKSGDLFVAAPPNGAAIAKDRCRGALQADLNAAANIGLRALLDPDFPGKWWYIPATMDAGWRVPTLKSCAGAACLDGWKVAHKDGYFSADGAPLAVADDESVKKAEDVVVAAKRELDTAKKAAKKRGADQAALDAAKKRHDEAKAALKEAKKSASQKEIINIWQDPAAARSAPSTGRWWETTAYWCWVRKRVVAVLWQANGLSAPPADLVRDGQP
jgi:IS605 OrfB family transposase